MITSVFDLVTLFITAILLWKNYRYFTRSSLYLIHFTFAILYVLPILLDYTIGFNEYSIKTWGFLISRSDTTTSLLYDAFVLYVQFVLVANRTRSRGYSHVYESSLTTESLTTPNYVYKLILVGAIAAPLWMIYNSASQFIVMFQWRETRLFDLPKGYAVAECLSYIGISCSVFLLFWRIESSKLFAFLQRIIAIFLLYVNICTEGKRAVMFFALCNIVVVLLFNYVFRKSLNSAQKAVIKWATSAAIILFSVYMISMTLETHATRGDSDNQLTTARIDFLRDDRVRMAIYAEIYPDQMQITEHLLQSVPDDLLSCFPLNFLASRIHHDVVMYQTRFTCAMSRESVNNITQDQKESYSFMTVSLLSEIISNLGLILGLICIPFVLLWFVKMINQYPSPINMMVFNSFFLLNLFDFSYVSYYIELTLLLIYLYHKKVLNR